MLAKIFTTFASTATIAFGTWHFFVPRDWNWYEYMSPEATELVVAVRATNVFFSLSLVLIGLANIIFTYGPSNRFTMIVMLTLSCVLWLVRCIMQIVFPQGSMNLWLQYGMLSAFIIMFSCFAISLLSVVAAK